MLHHVAQPALCQQQHLVRVRALADLLVNPGGDGPPEHGEALDQRLEGDPFLGVAARVLACLRVVLGPGQIRVWPERPEQRPQEVGRHRDQLLARTVRVTLEHLGLDRGDCLSRDHAALGGVRRKAVRNLSQQVTRSLRHIGAL